jgi:hypothetical protein
MEVPAHQRKNQARYSAEIIVEIVDSQNKVVPIRALLDTGTSEMILLNPFYHRLVFGDIKVQVSPHGKPWAVTLSLIVKQK